MQSTIQRLQTALDKRKAGRAELTETTANAESVLATEVKVQVLPSGMIAVMEKSDLLGKLPDNEDGLRQFRNLFKTLDTLLTSGVTPDKITKKTLKEVGYDKQGLILDDKELTSVRDLLASAKDI